LTRDAAVIAARTTRRQSRGDSQAAVEADRFREPGFAYASNEAKTLFERAMPGAPGAVQRATISAFTRVFDALWLRRTGAVQYAALKDAGSATQHSASLHAAQHPGMNARFSGSLQEQRANAKRPGDAGPLT